MCAHLESLVGLKAPPLRGHSTHLGSFSSAKQGSHFQGVPIQGIESVTIVREQNVILDVIFDGRNDDNYRASEGTEMQQ